MACHLINKLNKFLLIICILNWNNNEGSCVLDSTNSRQHNQKAFLLVFF